MQLAEGVWTPKLAGEELVEALRFLDVTMGRVGPNRVRSGMPSLNMTAGEREGEAWPSFAEIGEFDPPPQKPRRYPPARVSQLERVLEWPMRYTDPKETGAIRVLKTWLRCKTAKKVKFDAVCQARGWSRATAYRQRDRALAMIAIGLTADGIAFGSH
ncbi:MAG: hypothetical protein O9256_02000 [Rhizobiaceae bacterium]|nr:hypothetical protein [Rhizobiaceae bacterium]MCZ8349855.1 hypothetical protein [Rhizobium sp.]